MSGPTQLKPLSFGGQLYVSPEVVLNRKEGELLNENNREWEWKVVTAQPCSGAKCWWRSLRSI